MPRAGAAPESRHWRVETLWRRMVAILQFWSRVALELAEYPMVECSHAITGDQSLEALRRELAEAREQQATTAGILAAISNGPTDPFRVFAEIAAAAASLCDAHNSTINQVVIGDRLRLVARHGPLLTVAPVGQGSLPITRGSVTARAIIDKQTIHVADLQAATDEYPE